MVRVFVPAIPHAAPAPQELDYYRVVGIGAQDEAVDAGVHASSRVSCTGAYGHTPKGRQRAMGMGERPPICIR